MKCVAVLLFVACMQVSARGLGQTISLNVKDQPLQQVFQEIKKQTGYSFFYKVSLEDKFKKVTVRLVNASLQHVMDEVLKGQALDYEIINKTIVVKEKETGNEKAIGTTPPIDVRGKVIDENGKPVIATVQVKGTNKAVSTNEKGEFLVNGIDENAILVVSGVNIETMEVNVRGRTDLLLNTTLRTVQGENVTVNVNTGYQQLPKERSTGSFEFITREELNRKTGPDLLSRLEGVSTSLFFDRRDATGSQSIFPVNNIMIRGISTLTSGSMSTPLIILNNFPYEGDINNINPNDVENITILKDAAAASIYGARAANGVIVITTKQGKFNQPFKLSLNTSFRIIQKPDLFYYPTMSGSEFIDFEKFLFDRGAFDADLADPDYPAVSPVVEILAKKRAGTITAAEADAQINALRNLDLRKDFATEIYRTSFSQQYSLRANGGNDRFHYNVSAGFDASPAVLKGDQFKRITLALDNVYNVSPKATFQLAVRYTNSNNQNSSLGEYRSSAYNYQQGSNALYPYARLIDDNGNRLAIPRDYRTGYTDTAGQGRLLNWKYSPLDEMDHISRTLKTGEILISPNINIKLLSFLNLQLGYQYQGANQESRGLYDQQSYYARNMINLYTNLSETAPQLRNPVPIGGILDASNRRLTSHNGRAQLNVLKNWYGKHELSALAGAEIREVVNTSTASRFYGYNDNNYSYANVDFINSYPLYGGRGSRAIQQLAGLEKKTDHFVSFYGNAAYTFSKRYILSASIRKDAANLFGVSINNKWEPFWSVGGGWIISQEPFFKSGVVNYLKFRASYGLTGNVNNSLTPYTIITGTPASSSPFNVPYYWISTPANPSLSWETMKQVNAGVDFRLFNNRLAGSIEYYHKKSDNLILSAVMDVTTGIGSIERNSASLSGQGIELAANYQILKGTFNWTTEFSFNHIKNKIINFFGDGKGLTAGAIVSSAGLTVTTRIGYSPYGLFSLPFAGLDPATGDPLGYLGKSVSKNYTAIRNQRFDTAGVVYHGSTIPTVFGNFNQVFNWKKISLIVSADYRLGYWFRKNAIQYGALISSGRLHRDYSNRWQNPGDETRTNIPSIEFPLGNGDRDFFYGASSVNVLKGDNIKLRAIRLSYSIDNIQLARRKINRIQLYGVAENLGVIWRANNQGLDPDVNTGNALYPMPKRFGGGVTIDF